MDPHLSGIFLWLQCNDILGTSQSSFMLMKRKPPHVSYVKNYLPMKGWNWPLMLVIFPNSPSFFDISEGLKEISHYTSIFHVRMLMLFAPERTSFLPLDLQQPKSHHSPVRHQYPWDIITIHQSNKYLTWFLQAFNRENHIWDWECWVIRPGGQMGVLEEFQAICLFLFFIFYMKSMYLPVPQGRCCCQNYLCTSLISWAESHIPPFTVIINILYTKLPSEQGTWQDSAAMSATSQFWDFSFRNGKFQSPELWVFCLTSACLCRGLEVDWQEGWASVASLSIGCLRYPGRQWSLNGKSPGFGVSQTWGHFSAMSLCVYLGKSLQSFQDPF